MEGCWCSLLGEFKIILKIISVTEGDLSKVVSVTLLKFSFVIGNFQETFWELNKSSFQYKEHLWVVVSQAYKWRKYNSGRGVTGYFFLMIVIKA